MKRNIYIMVLLVGFTLLTVSCDPPFFSNTPSISFKELKVFRLSDRDSLIIRIDFKDGDGDLGLGPGDTTGPFSIKGPNFNNYKRTYWKKRGKDYVLAYLPSFSPGVNLNPVYERFPVLRVDGKTGPIEGTLDLSFIINYPPANTSDPDIPYPNDTLRFDVQIWDRSLNASNIVTSSDVVILSR